MELGSHLSVHQTWTSMNWSATVDSSEHENTFYVTVNAIQKETFQFTTRLWIWTINFGIICFLETAWFAQLIQVMKAWEYRRTKYIVRLHSSIYLKIAMFARQKSFNGTPVYTAVFFLPWIATKKHSLSLQKFAFSSDKDSLDQN